jgi:hypothetical protein
MLWRLLQIVVFLSVSFTGIYYEWTPNGLVLGIVAATCAFAATVLLGDFFRLVRWSANLARSVLGKQRTDQRLPPARKIL